VKANLGDKAFAAGIGGGLLSSVGTIIIADNADVTAYGGYLAAAIGGGGCSTGGTGGSVTAIYITGGRGFASATNSGRGVGPGHGASIEVFVGLGGEEACPTGQVYTWGQ